MKLEGKVAVVVGAGGSTGRALAVALASEGAQVVAADIDAGAAAKTVGDITIDGGQAISFEVDVLDRWSVSALAEAATEAYGGIDILVNNAGKHLREYIEGCVAIDEDRWDELLAVNVTGALRCARACVASMRARGGGVIVNRASTAGYELTNAYGVSRLAVVGMTTALAHELGPDGIRVNCIAPGVLDTPDMMRSLPQDFHEQAIARQRLHRHGRVSDLAGTIVFLCSEDSSFITGQTILVDGGLVTRL